MKKRNQVPKPTPAIAITAGVITKYREDDDEMKNIKLLGSGGFGSAYHYYHCRLGDIVIKKFKAPDRDCDTEIRNLARFQFNTKIIRLIGVLVSADGYCIGHVTEYMEEGSLHDAIYHQHIGDRENYANRIFLEVASGLDYIHQNGGIHKDIKPSNILIGSGKRVVIADLGLLGYHEDTRANVNGWTAAYTPPEILQRRQPATPAWDIYSMVVSYCETILKESPGPNLKNFKEQNIFEFSDKIKKAISDNPKERPTAKELNAYFSNRTTSAANSQNGDTFLTRSSSIGVRTKNLNENSDSTNTLCDILVIGKKCKAKCDWISLIRSTLKNGFNENCELPAFCGVTYSKPYKCWVVDTPEKKFRFYDCPGFLKPNDGKERLDTHSKLAEIATGTSGFNAILIIFDTPAVSNQMASGNNEDNIILLSLLSLLPKNWKSKLLFVFGTEQTRNYTPNGNTLRPLGDFLKKKVGLEIFNKEIIFHFNMINKDCDENSKEMQRLLLATSTKDFAEPVDDFLVLHNARIYARYLADHNKDFIKHDGAGTASLAKEWAKLNNYVKTNCMIDYMEMRFVPTHREKISIMENYSAREGAPTKRQAEILIENVHKSPERPNTIKKYELLTINREKVKEQLIADLKVMPSAQSTNFSSRNTSTSSSIRSISARLATQSTSRST